MQASVKPMWWEVATNRAICAATICLASFGTNLHAQLHPTRDCPAYLDPLASPIRASVAAVPQLDSQPVLVLRRLMISGTSPSYLLAICTDGNVTFIGSQNVRVFGTIRLRVDPNDVRSLMRVIHDEIDIVGLTRAMVDMQEAEERNRGKVLRGKVVVSPAFQLHVTHEGKRYSSMLDGLQERIPAQRARQFLSVVRAVEAIVPTTAFRCPAYLPDAIGRDGVVDRSVELCELEQRHLDSLSGLP